MLFGRTYKNSPRIASKNRPYLASWPFRPGGMAPSDPHREGLRPPLHFPREVGCEDARRNRVTFYTPNVVCASSLISHICSQVGEYQPPPRFVSSYLATLGHLQFTNWDLLSIRAIQNAFSSYRGAYNMR